MKDAIPGRPQTAPGSPGQTKRNAGNNDTAEQPSIDPPETPQQALGPKILPPCGANEFRLLELHGGGFLDQLQGTLRTYDLNNSPMYTAVSYTWGEERLGPRHYRPPMLLNGIAFPLERRNLESMLYDLRDPAMSRMLWIDAICIDQTDTSERNAQVSNMASIYSNADCVVIWLAADLGHWTDVEKLLALAVRPRSSCVMTVHTEWTLRRVCSHQYWTRAWIVQEVFSGRRVELQHGECCIPLELLVKGSEACRPATEALPLTLPKKLCSERLKRRNGVSSTDFRTLLLDYSYTECSDPRDKVFALLSLNAQAKKHVRVDYEMSPQSLLLETMNFLARVDGAPSRELISLGVSLKRQLKITKRTIRDEIQKWADSPPSGDPLVGLSAKLYLRGSVNSSMSPQGEALVPGARRAARPLATYPAMHFRGQKTVPLHRGDPKEQLDYILTSEVAATVQPPTISTRDYHVFGITPKAHGSASGRDPETIGLAHMRLATNQEIWQFVGTEVAFVCSSDEDNLHLFGRSYLASVGENDASFKWDSFDTIGGPLNERTLHLTSPLLLALIMWADARD
ncbi:hypothetical protein PV04_08953 [Phialophora macrospora]|uniref:Heterokaryon incompatibility domain-containing protein n=1 Tax=Phialophora macrospora TaxID=1851006 RepID=A0A0D2F7M8_9EURO|nr:hypothetical protein PV04_08953 [Phialophora macrospora]